MKPEEWLRSAQSKAKQLRGAIFGGLWVPRKVKSMNPATELMRSVVSWSDVYPDKPLPALDQIKNMVAEFNRDDIVQTLSRFNFARHASYASDGSFVRVANIRAFFSPEAYKRISSLEESHGSVVLSRSMLVMLQGICLSSCQHPGGRPVREQPQSLGLALLAAGSYCEGDDVARLGTDSLKKSREKDIVWGTLYRNFTFNRIDRVGWSFARYWFMMSKCAPMVPANDFFDIDDALEKTSNLPWKQELAFSYCALGHYIKEKPLQFLNERPEDFLLPPTFFQKTIIPGAGKSVLTRLSAHIDSVAESSSVRAYDFRWLFNSPLVRIDNGALYPLDVGALADRATSGIYWKLHDLLRGTADFDRFKGFWGRLFEEYARQFLEYCLPSGRLEKRLFVEHVDGFQGGVDFIIIDGAEAVFIQATTEHVPILEILSGDWGRIRKSLEALLIEREGKRGKAARLAQAITRFRKGNLKLQDIDHTKITRIYPVILMEQSIPQLPGIIDDIRSDLAARTDFGSQADYLEFWDAEEMELSEGLFRKGISKFIQDKHDRGLGGLPWKNYLHKVGHDSDSTFVIASYDTAGAEMKALLFGPKDQRVNDRGHR